MPDRVRGQIAGRCAASSERDDGCFSGGCERLDDPMIGLKGLVGDQPIGGHLRQQGIGCGQIISLPPQSAGTPRGCRVRRPRCGFSCSTRPCCDPSPDPHLFWARRRCAGGPARMVLSIIAHSLSASAARCCNTRCHSPFLARRLNRRCVFFQLPKRSGRSRQGIPARYRSRTASRNRRLSRAVAATSPAFPESRSLIRSP